MYDEIETSLSLKGFIKKIDEKIQLLTESLLCNGLGNPMQDNILRGKILAFRETKEILLNKKAQ